MSELVTRSPIELFWTAKKIKRKREKRKREKEKKGKREKHKNIKREKEKKGKKREKKTDSRNGLGRAPTYNRKILRRVSFVIPLVIYPWCLFISDDLV